MRLMAARRRDGPARVAGPWLLRAYPGWWRERYADEVAAILDARPPDLRGRIDLVRGAFDAHLRGAQPGVPRRAIAASLVAGGAWTIAGVAALAGPTPPDWPGYLASTLPIGLAGAVAILVASLGLARLAWASSALALELVVAAVVVGHLAWILALTVAVLGGPYGAVTAIAQSVAALGTVGLGLAVMRAGVRLGGEAVLVAGGAFLVPSPAAWLVVGVAWTAIGLWQLVASRPGDAARPLTG